MSGLTVRPFERDDQPFVLGITEAGFGEEGPVVADLVRALTSGHYDRPILPFVAHSGADLVGFVALSPIAVQGHPDLLGYLLAPLVVDPDYQHSGYGTTLVTRALDELPHQGVHVVLTYGDPDYYRRFGFEHVQAEMFVPPQRLAHPDGWLGRVLEPFDPPMSPLDITVCRAFDNPDLW